MEQHIQPIIYTVTASNMQYNCQNTTRGSFVATTWGYDTMKKITSIIIIVATIAVSLSGCILKYKYWYGNRPCDHPYSKWVSEDRLVSFSIDENGSGKGAILNGEESIAISVSIGPTTEIHIYPLESVDSESGIINADYLEYWNGDFKNQNKFSAVVKKTTFFNVGKKITFYRVYD